MLEFLRTLFGDNETLSFDQLENKATEAKLKIVNLADGRYVSKDKLDSLQAKYDSVNGLLTEANGKLQGYDPEWQAKVTAAEQSAAEKVTALQFDYALNLALKDAKARNTKAVRAMLKTEDLKLDNAGTISGLKEQLDALKTSDGYLFADDIPTGGTGSKGNFRRNSGEPVDFSKMTYSEMAAYVAAHPETKIE